MVPSVSIIIPVYNKETYLGQCLDSIAAQSFEDFEAIVVDDGSSDSSYSIGILYSDKDSRFKVFHQDNVGVAESRNFGINVAKGEFITFVDSDDWIAPEYLETLMRYADSSDHVIIGHNIFGDWNESIAFKRSESFDLNAQTGKIMDVGESYNIENTPYLYCWGQLYRKSIILTNGITFNPNLKLGEDTMFVLDYLSHTKRLSKVSGSLYMYRKHNCNFWKKYSMTGPEFESHVNCLRQKIELYNNRVGCDLPHLTSKNLEVYATCFRTYLKSENFITFNKQRNAFNDGDYSEIIPFLSDSNRRFYSSSGIQMYIEYIINKDMPILRVLHSCLKRVLCWR